MSTPRSLRFTEEEMHLLLDLVGRLSLREGRQISQREAVNFAVKEVLSRWDDGGWR